MGVSRRGWIGNRFVVAGSSGDCKVWKDQHGNVVNPDELKEGPPGSIWQFLLILVIFVLLVVAAIHDLFPAR